MQYNSAILYPAYIYKYIYINMNIYTYAVQESGLVSLCIFFCLFFIMWNFKESSSYCGFTWGIVIQWPCCYLNQKCVREWKGMLLCYFCVKIRKQNTRLTAYNWFKDTGWIHVWAQQVRSSKMSPERHFQVFKFIGWPIWGTDASVGKKSPRTSVNVSTFRCTEIHWFEVREWVEALIIFIRNILILLNLKTPSPAECMPYEEDDS